jgi:site-specific recombinase XerD
MENLSENTKNRILASNHFNDVLLDFLLSRQAMMCTKRTIDWYKYTLGKIIEWLIEHDVEEPQQISGRHIRAFLGELAERGCADSYMHTYARAMKTFSRFMLDEGYISDPIKFPMPKLADKRLRVYTANQIRQILVACKDIRETAFIQLMVDTGLRNAEVRNLNWGDVDISSGVIRVIHGKGRKARIAVVGVNTRRTLLKYRKQVDSQDNKPLIQTQSGGRFTESGLYSWLRRLSKRAKIHITTHALRRTFATLSLRAGMDVFQLQALLGHSSLEMTQHYVRLLDEDLIKTHKAHGPVDNMLKYNIK